MIDQLAKRLFEEISENTRQLEQKAMSSSHLKALLESALRKANLVSREEFDAQQAVLKRTREKLEKLEAKIAELENQA